MKLGGYVYERNQFQENQRLLFDHRDAYAALTAWYKTAKKAHWQSLVELKQTYPMADLVGRYVVFNIKGNKYRLIARVIYRSQTIFVVAVMTHEEYDLGNGKSENICA